VVGKTDATAILADSSGSLAGWLRGIVKWAAERMPPALGYATVANSLSTTATSNTAVAQTAVTVSTSAVKLPTTPLANRRAIYIVNLGGVTIFLGGSGVTTANGYPVAANGGISIAVGAGIDVYAIAASGSNDVRFLEVS